MAGYGKAKYGDSKYGVGSDEEEIVVSVDNVPSFEQGFVEPTNTIDFPFRFTSAGDVARTTEDVGIDNDVKLSVLLRQNSIPLFPLGVGVEDFVTDILDFPTQVWLSDRIAESVQLGVPLARALEDQIFFDESKLENNVVGVVVPYINLRTGKDSVAVLSVPRQRTDQ